MISLLIKGITVMVLGEGEGEDEHDDNRRSITRALITKPLSLVAIVVSQFSEGTANVESARSGSQSKPHSPI